MRGIGARRGMSTTMTGATPGAQRFRSLLCAQFAITTVITREKHIASMAMNLRLPILTLGRMGLGNVSRAGDSKRSANVLHHGGESADYARKEFPMGEHTTISWTDHTFNPWHGCTRVSPGCTNCYAETFDKRVGGDHWGPGKPRRTFSDKHWAEPLKWDAKAKRDGVRRRVFCASMADIFDVEAPEGQRERLWELIRKTPNLIWQLLTKRVEGYQDYLPLDLRVEPRVWKGFTAEDQERYDQRWAKMMRFLPGLVWVSYEPALGPLTFAKDCIAPAWAVFGGESGHHYRPCKPEWAIRLLLECEERNIAFFMKQMSARTPAEGKALIPADLLIHEFPS